MIKQGHKFHPHHPNIDGRDVVLASDYDALAAQRDEGLTREPELKRRLAAAEKDAARYRYLRDGYRGGIECWDEQICVCDSEDAVFDTALDTMVDNSMATMAERLSSHGCADVKKVAAPEVNLPRRKVKTEYSTSAEDAQADAWNAALDAVETMNK